MSHPDPIQVPSEDIATLPEVDFVPVFYASTRSEAERLKELLLAHGMAALMGTRASGAMRAFSPGWPVLVEHAVFDRASELMATFEASASNDWEEDEDDVDTFDDDDEDDDDEDFDEDDDLDLDDEDDFDDDDDDEDDEFDLDLDEDDEL